MAGILYGIGVGPGDPELMTLKAVRILREIGVVACPGERAEESTAYRIAAGAVPEIAEKELVGIPMPMVMDKAAREDAHRKGAETLERYLREGRDVAFLTLGDPTVYSTFSYLQHRIEEKGLKVRLISGVPSFCAAAAALNLPLAEWDEPVHILPAVHRDLLEAELPGTLVLMKTGRRMKEVKEYLQKSGRVTAMAENCGLPGERLFRSAEEIPEDAGYFSLIIAREQG